MCFPFFFFEKHFLKTPLWFFERFGFFARLFFKNLLFIFNTFSVSNMLQTSINIEFMFGGILIAKCIEMLYILSPLDGFVSENTFLISKNSPQKSYLT